MHYTNKYTSYGFSSPMGLKLRAYTEAQLYADLLIYYPECNAVKFDWSKSVVEGDTADYLDGSLENYSSIIIDDNDGNFIAEGWMDFVFNGDVLIIYWDLLEFSKDLLALDKCFNKSEFGMPPHISKIIGGHS